MKIKVGQIVEVSKFSNVEEDFGYDVIAVEGDKIVIKNASSGNEYAITVDDVHKVFDNEDSF